jgi:hypothetical protein
VPTASPVVLQVAMLLEIDLEPHPEIVIPPEVKFTVPVAPVVTVAVNVTEPPMTIEVDVDARVTAEELPGITATRGVER